MECGLTYKNLYIKDFKVSSKKYGFIKNGITMKVISDYLVKNNIDKTFDDVYDNITADDLFEYQRWSSYYNYLLSDFLNNLFQFKLPLKYTLTLFLIEYKSK